MSLCTSVNYVRPLATSFTRTVTGLKKNHMHEMEDPILTFQTLFVLIYCRGEAIISMEEVLEKCTGEPFSLKLHPRTNESVSGEVQLRCLFEGTLDPEKDPDPPAYVATSFNATAASLTDSQPSSDDKKDEGRRITSGGLAGKAKRRMTPPKEKGVRGTRSATLRASGSGNAINSQGSHSAPNSPNVQDPTQRRGSAGAATKGSSFDPISAALGGAGGGLGRTISGKFGVGGSPIRSGSLSKDDTSDSDSGSGEKDSGKKERKVKRTLSDGGRANRASDPAPPVSNPPGSDGAHPSDSEISKVVLKHYSPVQRAASKGGDPKMVCDMVLGSATTIIKNTYTLQANVKSIAEGSPDSEELKNNFRALSTATIRLMMNITEQVKKLDIPQSEPFLFLKKKTLMQNASKAEEVVIQFIRSGKSLVQAHESKPELAAFQNIVKNMATAIKQLTDSVTDIKEHI
jgi:hypothetical protein